MVDEMMIESGAKFGKYRLLERLAVGGMAEIYKASAGGLDGFEKIVAIKRLHRQFSEDSDFATMLIDEAQLVVQLSHANIGQVFDLGCIDGQYFIVMEFIDGLDLHELGERAAQLGRQLPIDAIVAIAIEVAEALHYAHTKRGVDGKSLEIVHRDVSPQNIMVSADGEVKLVDFGIAKARMRAQQTQAGIIKGKFYYMSPEQALGHRIDARSDVFALGMVLYEGLTGGHPFDDVPDGELLRAVRAADFAPLREVRPDLPEELSSIVDRALMPAKERRYESALALKKALDSYQARTGVRVTRMRLAEVVRSYDGSYLPETTRAASSFEAMSRQHFRSSQESVIFDAFGVDDDLQDEEFEGEATAVFLRGDDEREEAHREMAEAEFQDTTRDLDRFDQERLRQVSAVAARESMTEGSVRGPEVLSTPMDSGPARETHSGEAQGTARVSEKVEHWLRRRPLLVGALLAVVALSMLFAAAMLSWGDQGAEVREGEQAWHAGIAPTKGDEESLKEKMLAVSTDPGNADLYVNDDYRGKTPTTIRELEVGQRLVLRFERDGYTPKELTLMVEYDSPPLVVRLEPLGAILRARSEPEGAEIFVNGERRGVAPATIMGLERNVDYEVEARFGDQAPQTEVVHWSEDERTQELLFRFEMPEERPGVELSTREPRRSRRPASRRPPGRSSHNEVSEGEPIAVNPFEVVAADERGRLNVRVNADRGRIFVDGNLIEEGTVLVGHRLDAGTYEVQVYFPTLERYSAPRQVEVRPGETATITISP